MNPYEPPPTERPQGNLLKEWSRRVVVVFSVVALFGCGFLVVALLSGLWDILDENSSGRDVIKMVAALVASALVASVASLAMARLMRRYQHRTGKP